MDRPSDWYANIDVCVPPDVAARMLSRVYGDPASAPDSAGLAPFQDDAVERIQSIIRRRRGAILADSVGLGKTHVAAAFIRAAIQTRRPVIVSGPASLAVHWRRHLRSESGWRWLSHSALSRQSFGITRLAPSSRRALVVVDEAHGFRNPRARRYAALARLCTAADLLLITATPVNNSLMDLYHLIRLFARDGDFGNAGVPDLLNAFRLAAEQGDTHLLRLVVRAVMVRRTRRFIGRHYGNVYPERGGLLRFPAREPTRRIRYDLEAQYPKLRTHLLEGISALRFPAHCVSDGHPPIELLRLGLLKRLESSVSALGASLERHRVLLSEFTDAALRGLLFDLRISRLQNTTISRQLTLQELTLRPWPHGLDRDRLLRLATEDSARVQLLMKDLGSSASDDPKLKTLHALVADEYPSEKIVVFAEYRDTAIAVWRRLLPCGGVGLIHGTDVRLGAARSSRRAVLDRFAPLANHAKPPRAHERVRILVCTDVLSEGLNLQDARVVISYDMPWNPVRLAQREGRIDRLGSPHTSILPCVFVPDRGVDSMLGLMGIVRRKLHAIRVAGVGAGQSVVHRSVIDASDRHGLLWLEYLRQCRQGIGTVQNSAIPVAAMAWGEPERAVLCCISDTDRSWLVLCREGQPTVIDTDDADDILIRALRQPDPRQPDGEWVRAAGSAAVEAVIASEWTRRQPPTSRIARLAARRVHAWLAARPGGPSAADCADADLILKFLTIPMDTTSEHRLASAIRGRRPDSDLRALIRLSRRWRGNACLTDDDGRTRSVGHDEVGRIAPVALLELVPAAEASRG
jgi:superfamily II DNA or RNA helicase